MSEIQIHDAPGSQALVYDGFAYHHANDSHPGDLKDKLIVHWHKMYELYVFISGEGNFLVGNTVYKLQPGDMVLLRPGEFHQFVPTSPEDYERYSLHFEKDLMDGDDLLLAPFHDREMGENNLLRPDRATVLDILKRLDMSLRLPPDYCRAMSRFVLGELLTYVAVFAKTQERLIGGDQLPPLVERMLQYIHEHLTDSLNLDILSEQVFMTKPHIGRVFKSAMGIAPMEYVTRKRIQLARQYLQAGMRAEETAVRCGFGDYSSFYRAYKRIMGRSPRHADKEKSL